MVGAPTAGENLLDALFAALGAFLLVEGCLVMVMPSPKLSIVQGVAIILVGASNMYFSGRNLAAGEGSALDLFFILGIVQVVIGIGSIRDYRRFADLPEKPPEETIRRVDTMVGNLLRTSPKTDPGIIEILVKGGIGPTLWRTKLLGDAALLVRKGPRQEVIFATRDDIEFAEQPGKQEAGKLPAMFRIAGRKLFGRISPEHYDRYASWKGTGEEPHGLVEIAE